MPSQLQDTNVGDIPWGSLTTEQLADLRDNDDRSSVQSRAAALYDERNAPTPAPTLDEYDPRSDLGPPRREDSINLLPEDFEPAETTDEEVPLEESRKDETTLLATDTVRVNEDNELEIIPASE